MFSCSYACPTPKSKAAADSAELARKGGIEIKRVPAQFDGEK